MSGTASRYITGVPYGPGMGVGRYPSAASVMSPPGVRPGPGYTPPPAVDASGIAVDPRTGVVAPAALQGGDLDLTNLLLQAGLGALGYAPEIYDLATRMIGGPEQVTQQGDALPLPPEQAPPPTVPPGAVPFGMSDAYGQLWGVERQPGLFETFNTSGQSVGSIDMTAGAFDEGSALFDGGDLGIVDPAFFEPAPPGMGGQIAPDAVQGGQFTALPAEDPFGLTGSLGEFGGFDIATGLADLAGGAAGGWAASQYAANRREPNAGYGQQIGSTIGAIAGSFIPVPVLGTAVGAALGGVLGTEIGGSIGAPPTIGRNFSVMGTLGGDGQIYWGQGGGDNGGTGADALAFANDFSMNLLRQASQQGLRFNPATAGAQFTVGGFDNFSRRYQTPGGYFYDPYNGASPENYALRPEAGFDAFSPQQADAFTRAVLQDLAARNVFTPTGAGENLYGSGIAGGLGFYGPQGLSYSDPAMGGAQFQGNTGNFLQDVMYRQADIRANNTMAQQAAADEAQRAADRAAWEAQATAAVPGYQDGGG